MEVARGLSDAVDVVVRQTWARVGGNPAAAIVAVGGYGRREMSPSSDVDFIVLHGRRDDVSAPVKALAYDLWDLGLELGYALHTPSEAIRLAGLRLDSQTAFLDARLVTGNPELFGDWHALVQDRVRRSLAGFVEQLRQATIARRLKAGDAGAELEPNLKEGRGGLRDLVTIRWLNLAAGESPLSLERDPLGAAARFLLRVRHELHFLSGRRSDVLAMRDQAEVAAHLGVAEEGMLAENALMRELYSHCRTIGYTLDQALFPVQGVRFCAGAAPLAEPWPDAARATFLRLLRGVDARRAFEVLDHSGQLVQALPEWAAIRCLPQRNIYHRFAVDIHCVETVVALSSLTGNDNQILADAAADARADWDTLVLACLLHDIGKGSGEDHSVRGESLARSAAERMGLDPGCASDIAWLVRHHLVLAETATRRDIRDEGVIGGFAELAGSARRLRMLLLLTASDGIATGLSAWSPWKATLVTRLYARVQRVLEQGDPVADELETLQRHRRGLRQSLAGFPGDLVEAHLANMPTEWLLSQPPAELVRQSQAMLSPPPERDITIAAELQVESGVWEVAVVAVDRPGLFSKVSGGLALHGLNVLGAEVYTREDGVALEVFRLEALGNEEHRFERVVEDVGKALRGRLSLEVRLAEKRLEYGGRVRKGKGEPPRVIVDNGSSALYSLVEVHAEDTIGLLYAITKALVELGLDIHKAKISTYGHDVVDVFYVRDLDGAKATDPDHMAEVERAVLFALATARS
ncbi:MAG: hypothetical protein NVSMB32_04830 [Actinomycetota bacterium]